MSTKPCTVLKYSEYLRTELPAHWLEKRLGYLSMQVRNAFVDGPFGSDLKTTDYQDEGVPLIQLNNIRDSKHVLQNMKFISDEKRNQLKRHIAKPKDVVFAKMADPVARSAVVANDFPEYVIVADCVKMTPDLALVDLNFLVWAINSDCVRINAELVSTGTTRVRVSLGDLQKLKIPYPPIDEQQAIARFLDHETAKIDALIEKQQRLIELLKEKRQAVISHAVTKGLNPNAPMKDSGVEWLGEVPAHWVSTRLKYLKGLEPNSFVDGPFGSNLKSEHFVDDGVVYVIESGFATTAQLDTAQLKKITLQHYETIKRSTTKGGDIIIAKIGARYGSSSILPELDSKAVVSGNSLKLTVNESLLTNEFANELLRVLKANDAMDDGVNITAQPALSLGGLNNLPFLRIPLSEQHEIVKFIKEQNEIFDGLIEKAALFIDLSIERRTALISAAVTGKIDVRDWQAAA